MAGFTLAFLFGLLGNVISFMVFLAPIPAFRQIYKKKSSEGFQSLPYVIALFSAILWIYYAILKPNNTLLFTINAVGCFIETIYIGFHLFYASKNSRMQTSKLLIGLVVIGFGFIVVGTEFLVRPSQRDNVVGWICLIFSLCVFVAPLAIVRKVIKTKSVEYMPFLLSFFLTLSSVMWFFYGLLLKDFVIAVPNVLGFVFGILQMILYFVYKNKGIANDKKLAEIAAKTGETKFPEITERMGEIKLSEVQNKSKSVNEQINPELNHELVIDVAKLGSLLRPDQKIPAVNPPFTNGIEASQRQNVHVECQA